MRKFDAPWGGSGISGECRHLPPVGSSPRARREWRPAWRRPGGKRAAPSQEPPPLVRILCLLCLLGVVAVQAASRPLNLFIWSEYIDPAVVADFEKQFDSKVTIDLYEDDAAIPGAKARLYDEIWTQIKAR